MSLEYCEAVAKALFDAGVQEFCVAAGSRNAALLLVLSQAPVKKYAFVDERSAAFFALGRIKATGRPVAVVCTSGTAAAEFLPATVEAHYAGMPLVLVTCDRPRSYRNTGAPQSIEQVGLFGSYLEHEWDLAAGEPIPKNLVAAHRPTHINLCLEEHPLEARDTALFWGQLPKYLNAPRNRDALTDAAFTQAITEAERLLGQMKHPLVLVSQLDAAEVPAVEKFLLRLGAPIYAEAISNLRESEALKPFRLVSGEAILSRQPWDGVIRIGGIPTTRFWRDLDSDNTPFAELPLLHLSARPFKGLRRGHLLSIADVSVLDELKVPSYQPDVELRQKDATLATEVAKLFDRFPQSEPALVHALSKVLPRDSQIYLGNSMPIREWDLFASRDPRGHRYFANRGANGIDGQVSTFLGLATEATKQTFGLIGDMTCLHDSGALWAEKQLVCAGYALIVINNHGGKIFSRVKSLKTGPQAFVQQYLHQKHDFDFSKLALMWDLPFSSWQSIPEDLEISERGLIEIRPDDGETEAFWRSYGKLA